MKRDGFGRQERSGETRQCGILRPAYLYFSVQRSSASNQEFIHLRKKSRSIGPFNSKVLSIREINVITDGTAGRIAIAALLSENHLTE